MFDSCKGMNIERGDFQEIGGSFYQSGNTFNNNSSYSRNTSTATTTDSNNSLNATNDKTQNNHVYANGVGYDDFHRQQTNGNPTHLNIASPPLLPPEPSNFTQQAKLAKAVAQDMKARSLEHRQNVGIPAPIAAFPAQSSNERPWSRASPSNDSRYQTSPRPSQYNGMATLSPSLSSGNPYMHPGTPTSQAYPTQHRHNPFLNPSHHPSQGMAPQGQDAGDASMDGDDENEDRAGPVLRPRPF